MIVYTSFLECDRKKIALLIDPDKCTEADVKKRIDIAEEAEIDYIFVGGSLITRNIFENCISWIKAHCSIPIIIFPGNSQQISENADAILFLSLISGRNADLLIGNQIQTAPLIRQMGLESISTGYMLIESGRMTAVQYVSGTLPIPYDKSDIAKCTAIAGEMLGFKAIYMDAGSGAQNHVSSKMIQEVKNSISIPLIVGGGIRTVEQAVEVAKSGADIIVIGNAAETNPNIMFEMKKAVSKI